MNSIKLTVEKSTATKTGNFCNKLTANQTVETPFGEVEQQVTYYLYTKTENKAGISHELNIDLFDVVSKDFEFLDEANQKQTATLKYLYPKKAA